VYSLNAPLPPAIREVTATVRPALVGFDAVRESRSQTLVVKRLGVDDRRAYLGAADRARDALRGAPAVEARIADVGVFEDPPNGRGPVAYLAVESPGLRRLHDRLAEVIDPIPDLEGGDYVPHVTLARGGDGAAVERLGDVAFEPVTWTVDALEFYDARHGERIETLSLPA